MLVLTLTIFVGALWSGLYLISRDPRSPRLYLSGIGLVLYAVCLGVEALVPYTTAPQIIQTLTVVSQALLPLPAVC